LSERHAYRVRQQWRGTQRDLPMQQADEDALTKAIIALASEYGRYGYGRNQATANPSARAPRTISMTYRGSQTTASGKRPERVRGVKEGEKKREEKVDRNRRTRKRKWKKVMTTTAMVTAPTIIMMMAVAETDLSVTPRLLALAKQDHSKRVGGGGALLNP
jgi:hypothetical protein